MSETPILTTIPITGFHTLRYTFVSHLLEQDDVNITMIYAHVLNRGGKGSRVLSTIFRINNKGYYIETI